MARDDWFRRTTWSAADADAFNARLRRARTTFHKAQYLRIQAYTLGQTRKEPLTRAALDLLQRIFTEFPEPSELASAHLRAAQCHEFLGNIDQAIVHFRCSMDCQTKYPNRDVGVLLEFPWFVVTHKLSPLYAEALSVLQHAHLAFPVQSFKAAAARALVACEHGDSETAAKNAQAALDAAKLEQSQFRNHRPLGLVGKEYQSVIEQLHAIAAV